MPPKKLKSREGNAQLPGPVSKFPFRVGHEVEMKSFESGYRGAWFRVQIKKIRLDRKGNILCTMGYKDYSDESEEEILAFEKDPASNQRILMMRPLPPPSVKESKFNKNVHTKMCVVYRDEWEVGDLVDWWYHHCWWAAKVISVVGDGRFQLVCPAPPGGEGGVYLANSRDLRPSLKWSIAAQWTAPPSKEIGKIPCARIVWLLDSNEVAEFSAPNHDRVPQKRGRPKVMRVVSSPLDRRETPLIAPPLYPDRDPGRSRRPSLLSSPPLRTHYQDTGAVAAPNRDMKVPQKRGRPRKVERQEDAAMKRRRPIVIKIIHPRQDPEYEKVERMLKESSIDEATPAVQEERSFDTQPENEIGEGAMQEAGMTGKQLEDENRNWLKKASPLDENQLEEGNRPGIEHEVSVIARQVPEEKRRGIKQKRSVIRIPDKVSIIRENQFSNGHSDEAKRRKLEHIARISEPNAGDEHERKQYSKDQDCKKPQKWKNDVKDHDAGGNVPKDELMIVNSKIRKQNKFDKNTVTVQSMLMSHVGDVVVQHMLDFVPREQITLPCLDEGKDTSVDQTSGQQSKGEKQNGELQGEAFSSNFTSNYVNGELKMPEEDLGVGEDLKVLKVLNAYGFREALVDTACLEVNSSYLSHVQSAKDDICAMRQKSVEVNQDISVVKAYEEAFISDIQSPRRKSSLAASSNLTKSRDCEVTCNQGQLVKVTKDSSPCKQVSSLNTKSKMLQDSHMEKAAKFRANMLSHDVVIGRAGSSVDTVSVGGSQESFSSRMANISADEETKDSACSHDGAPYFDDKESGSSLNLESSYDNRSRKSANVCLTSGGIGMKAENSAKNELSSARTRIQKSVINHKLSLSRKLIDQARREISAKRRRNCRSTHRG